VPIAGNREKGRDRNIERERRRKIYIYREKQREKRGGVNQNCCKLTCGRG